MVRMRGNGTRRRHTHEEIIRVRRITSNAKQLHQVVELTMNIAAYLQVD